MAATLIARESSYKNTEIEFCKDIRALEVCLEKYEATGIPPEGYQRNSSGHPSLLIPHNNGLFRPAYWIKQLNNGKAAMLDKEGDYAHPYITDIYSASRYDATHPYSPIPAWFRQLLAGPSVLFDQLRDAAADLDDWGVLADILRFRQQDDKLGQLYAIIEQRQAELDGLKLARSITQSRLEAAQVHLQLGELEGLNMGHPLFCP